MPYNEGPFERVVNVGWSTTPSIVGTWVRTNPGFLTNLPLALDPDRTMGLYAGRNPCGGLAPFGWPLTEPYDLGGGAFVYGNILYIPATPPVYEVQAEFRNVFSAPPPPPFINATIRGLTSGSVVNWQGVACRDNSFGFGNTRERPVGGDFYSVGVPQISTTVFYRGLMRVDPQMIAGEQVEAF